MKVSATLYARKFEDRDIEKLYQYKNDAELNSCLGGFHAGYSRADLLAWVDFHNSHAREFLRCLATVDEDACVGQAGFYNIDHRARNAEFALAIFEPTWQGRGVGTEVSKAFLCYGFEELNFHRVYLTALAPNERAVRVYKKLGFQTEGIQRQAQFQGNRFHDVVSMSLLRPEWQAASWSGQAEAKV